VLFGGEHWIARGYFRHPMKGGKLFDTQIIFASLCLALLSGCHHEIIGILNPKGIVAFQERKLLIDPEILK